MIITLDIYLVAQIDNAILCEKKIRPSMYPSIKFFDNQQRGNLLQYFSHARGGKFTIS